MQNSFSSPKMPNLTVATVFFIYVCVSVYCCHVAKARTAEESAQEFNCNDNNVLNLFPSLP